MDLPLEIMNEIYKRADTKTQISMSKVAPIKASLSTQQKKEVIEDEFILKLESYYNKVNDISIGLAFLRRHMMEIQNKNMYNKHCYACNEFGRSGFDMKSHIMNDHMRVMYAHKKNLNRSAMAMAVWTSDRTGRRITEETLLNEIEQFFCKPLEELIEDEDGLVSFFFRDYNHPNRQLYDNEYKKDKISIEECNIDVRKLYTTHVGCPLCKDPHKVITFERLMNHHKHNIHCDNVKLINSSLKDIMDEHLTKLKPLIDIHH